MKIYLYSKDENFGEIILNSGSIHTKEFKGMLIAKNDYFKHRFAIRTYYEDLKYRPTNGFFWKILNRLDKRGNKIINEIQDLELTIKSNDLTLTNDNSEIIIQDTLRKTSKGNWFIQLDVLNLRIPQDFPEFELYNVEWIYPAPPDGIIGISKKGKLIREY